MASPIMGRALQRWIVLIFLSILTIYYLIHIHTLPFSSSSSEPKHIDWSAIPLKHPVSNLLKYPDVSPARLPAIQAPATTFAKETAREHSERDTRRSEVKRVFQRSWNAYKTAAWAHDELAPVSGGWKDHFGGWGATLVDALDTLLIMGMDDEFAAALAAVRRIDFSTTHVRTLNVFETTIRYLGGLLGAHQLATQTADKRALLDKAEELAHMLYHAFDTPNHMPIARWSWMQSYEGMPERPSVYTLAAEAGSMFLEFTKMTQETGDMRFYDVVQRISNVMATEQKQTKLPGLYPIMFDAENMSFKDDNTFTLGGRADSMYEYISKSFILVGGQSPQHKSMYEEWVDAAKKHIFFKPMNPKNLDILIAGTVSVNDGDISLNPEGQHLTCYLGGLLAVGSKVFDRPDDLDTAKKLVDGCSWAYDSTATGIMPEVFVAVPPSEKTPKNKWDRTRWLESVNHAYPMGSPDEVVDTLARAEQVATSNRLPQGMADIKDRRYMLRAGAIESLFVIYRVTGDKKYQDQAWKIFNAITSSCETSFSYSSIPDVTLKDSSRTDASESFWMAETLKYFYLIFSDHDVLSLDDYVFNTEAHPFKIPK